MAEESDQKEQAKGAAAIKLREELVKVLQNCKVSDLDINPKVIVLDCKTDPKKAIEVLIQNKIRAAPVIDNATSQFIGVLDLRDCVQFALETYAKHSSKLQEVKKKAMEFLTSSPQITTQSLKYLCQMRKFGTVKTTDTLLTVSAVLAKGSHIVGVIDDSKNKLVGLVTQGMLFQQVAKKWLDSVLKGNDNKNAEQVLLSELYDLQYITHPVKSISATAKAYELRALLSFICIFVLFHFVVALIRAFNMMSKQNLSGLAVVNADGVLIHNTSATDIKLWLTASSTLEDTIEQFLISIRKLSLTERYPITVCTLKDTFKRGIQKIQATKYHRLWIVDDKTKPIGVLALTDIFKFICKSKEIQQKNNDDQKNDK